MVLTYFKVLLQHLCGGTLIRRIDLQADISNAKQRPVWAEPPKIYTRILKSFTYGEYLTEYEWKSIPTVCRVIAFTVCNIWT